LVIWIIKKIIMGLISRKRTGNLISGSKLVVPGNNILTYKKFQNDFQGKKGSNPESYTQNPQNSGTTINT